MGKLQVMRSNHVGLKIAAVAGEDWDYEAKVEIFNINFCSFKQILVVLRHIVYQQLRST